MTFPDTILSGNEVRSIDPLDFTPHRCGGMNLGANHAC